MFKRILLPLDGSALGEAILPQIFHILRKEDSEIVLLRVAQPEKATEGGQLNPFVVPETVSQARTYLTRVEERLSGQGARVRSLVHVGAPAPVILDAAWREQVSMIAMMTHGHSGMARWVFGSVAEKVLRASTVPLLLLRSFPEGGALASSEPLRFERVLVPIANLHFRILGYVQELALHFGSKITLLHVVEPGEDGSTKDEGATELRRVQQDLEAAGVPTEIRERHGDPAMQILECARDENADLIAMTTHGRTGPSRWVIGSVTEKVLRSAVVPMLVVRNP